MIKKEAIQLKSLSSAIETVKRPETEAAKAAKEEPGEVVEEDRYVVRLNVHNPESRTLYAYGTARRIQYDNSTRNLRLSLHDQYVDENNVIAIHLKRPKIVPLEANADTEIKLALPQVINRLRSASERAGGPLVEKLNISEATNIDIEVAHQDTPFYYNPKVSMVKQLKQWGSAVAAATFGVKPPPGDEPYGTGESPPRRPTAASKKKTGQPKPKKTAPKKGGPSQKKGKK